MGFSGGWASRPTTPLRVYIPCRSGWVCPLAAIVTANKIAAIRTLLERSILEFLLLLVKDALVFQQLGVLIDPAIERHTHGPRPREDFGILHGRLVRNVIRTRKRVTLHHVQRIAVEIAGVV